MENRALEIIPDTIVTMAAQKLNEVKALLAPYLQTLTAGERKKLLKMSNQSFGFVTKAVQYCQQNPQFIPGYIEFDKLNNDYGVMAAIRPLFETCTQLQSDLDDTAMRAGSDAFSQCLLYYYNVEMAAGKGEQVATPIMEDLTERFFGVI
ncbi:hypothetical protein [Taibaiella soli]|uniref:Uncharacterized protein n=1 Tax=Taibaiella soli TaxID=1649169 RepID=A0A2W2A6A3_9BACT|nr:hypothetical protein [Taibaiella soli]PZF70761.1 hypothetical protein DN068_21845 [Taibaiella soli]